MRTEEVFNGVGGPEVASDPVAMLTGLFRDHQLELVRMALLIVGDRPSAEDVVQDVFTAMHGRLDRLREHHAMLPYARTAVINRCRTVLRRRKLAGRLHQHHEPPVWSAEAAAMLGEDCREVFEALRGLPRRRREVLVLRYYLNLSDAEIAEVMGVSAGTVKSTMSRALTALAKKLEDS
ncbi:SigE family RNA polymerase sigma factor [Spirillospora sp. NPDC048911]|uniref:SigE family RNA polymerase sigma factor n=1 Tax=Spirillospora sp. NPDC048911 TaxID=3364527 RepID=UPI003713DFCD